jgi:hypothetical protein
MLVQHQNQSKREVFSDGYFGEVEIETIKKCRIRIFCNEPAVTKSSSLHYFCTDNLHTFIYFGCKLFDSMVLIIPFRMFILAFR